MKKMIFYITLLLCSILFGAKDSPFENFIVGVWPEYDHPGILIIYTGTVKQNRLPLPFEILVPQETQMAVGVGHVDTTEALMPLEITEINDEKWLTTTLVKTEFQLQIYYNPFDDSEIRQFDLQLRFSQPLSEFHIAVQEPLVAEESFQFSEFDSEKFTDEHGLTYYRVHIHELAEGETKNISASYHNHSGKLTIDLLREMLGAGSGSSVQSRSQTSKVRVGSYRLPTYEPLAVLAVLTFIIGFIFWRSNHGQESKGEGRSNGQFCTKCGNKVKPQNKFCSKCGNKVK